MYFSSLCCCENTAGDENKAYADPVLLQDRVLKSLLRAEDRYVIESHIRISNVQREVTLEMRGIVAEWMMEVCEEQKCQDSVFSLAMNCMDRFLSRTSIRKNQLQLLGTTCLLIASKLKESRPIPAETLVYYTENSVTKQLLTSWECLVLSTLKWDVAAVVPQDFLKHLLNKIDLTSSGISYDMVDKHAKTIITLCSREFQFSKCCPSIVACAAIASALCGIGWTTKSGRTLESLLEELSNITVIDLEYIHQCLMQIELMINASLACCNSGNSAATGSTSETELLEDNSSLRPDEVTPPPQKSSEYKTALTPTDVHDVHF